MLSYHVHVYPYYTYLRVFTYYTIICVVLIVNDTTLNVTWRYHVSGLQTILETH